VEDEAFLSRLKQLSPPGGTGEPDLGCLGQYQLLARLGEGGMGAVYKARHLQLGKVVALKVLPAGLMNELSVARFHNEMKAVGRLDHPNIVAAHDAGQVGGTHFLVMEFVDGLDLSRLVRRHGRLPLADACELIRQAALGLQHAHERGLVHRDVKPSNLMLTRGGVVKVLDLGLARSLAEGPPAERLTATRQVIGTADYLAPEQWEDPHAADARADVYGLGCTLYHLAAGEAPFGGDRYRTWAQKMRAHQETPAPPLRQRCPEAPEALAAVLDRMLAKDPADRHPSPGDVAEALRPFTAGCDPARLLAGNPSGAVPPAPDADTARPGQALQRTRSEGGRGGRVGPIARRHYGWAAGLAAGLGLLLVGALVLRSRLREPADEKPLQVAAMNVNHFRGPDPTLLGEIKTTPEPIRRDDDVEVLVELSAPGYCYLIAFNPDGTEQLCYPEGEGAGGVTTAPPARKADLRFPEAKYFGLDAGGLQVFVLAASRKPLPPYPEWRSGIDRIPWERAEGSGIWRFDGQKLVRLAEGVRRRVEPPAPSTGAARVGWPAFMTAKSGGGVVRGRGDPPKALAELCEFFKGRAEFDAVEILAFRVGDE
jgi:hypothetical protein